MKVISGFYDILFIKFMLKQIKIIRNLIINILVLILKILKVQVQRRKSRFMISEGSPNIAKRKFQSSFN
jgi:hypothetical protein